jgi:MraZ protein
MGIRWAGCPFHTQSGLFSKEEEGDPRELGTSMLAQQDLILGEFPRSLDERHRVSIPAELAEPLTHGGLECILAKERPGCLSLWNAATWQVRLDQGVELVKTKLRSGKLAERYEEVQQLSRLLSTRHKNVQLAGRGRLTIPEGFRAFLQLDPGGEVIVVGAGVCVEIWNPRGWFAYLDQQIPDFRRLFDTLSS